MLTLLDKQSKYDFPKSSGASVKFIGNIVEFEYSSEFDRANPSGYDSYSVICSRKEYEKQLDLLINSGYCLIKDRNTDLELTKNKGLVNALFREGVNSTLLIGAYSLDDLMT